MLLARSVAVLLAASLVACVDDAPQAPLSEHGSWEVVSATRGQRPTSLLNQAYMVFDTATQTLSTNLTSEEIELPYTRQQNRITTRGSVVLTGLELTEVTDSTIAMSTEMANTPFTLELVRTD